MRGDSEYRFKSEAELCAVFMTALGTERRRQGARERDWTAYPETWGWDILLARNSDGFQIGLQAKLKFGIDVIQQTIEDSWAFRSERCGPDARGVLVPDYVDGKWTRICGYIGLTVVRVHRQASRYGRGGNMFYPALPNETDRWHSDGHWYDWMPHRRHKLPDYVPDVPAGMPAPLQLTSWKISALKLEATLEIRGFVTKHDFKHLGIDHRRWTARAAECLVPGPTGYTRGRYFPNHSRTHPVVYAEIKEDAPTWLLDLGTVKTPLPRRKR